MPKVVFQVQIGFKSDSYRSGRPSALDNDVLRAEVEANPCQTIEELSNSLNKPWSTIQEHLKQIGKVRRAGVWVPHNLSEQNKANRSITCNFNDTTQKRFLIAWSQEMRNGSCMITQNAKGSGSLQMKSLGVLLSQVYTPKKRFCVFGGVFAALFILNYWNLDKLLLQTSTANNCSESINL